jgi:hypothetical protein
MNTLSCINISKRVVSILFGMLFLCCSQAAFALIDPCNIAENSQKTLCDINITIKALNDSRAKADAVKPKGNLQVTVTGKLNPNSDPKNIILSFSGDTNYWNNSSGAANLSFLSINKTMGVVTFQKTLNAPAQIGQHTLKWKVPGIIDKKKVYTGNEISKNVEVTCSDSNFSNGEERYVFVDNKVGYQCRNALVLPCKDNSSCTTDTVVDGMFCEITPIDANCPTCSGASCTPNCSGKTCGSDGCGGFCNNNNGLCQGAGEICNAGTCTTDKPLGSCYAPIDLNYSSFTSSITKDITGDTTNGLSVFSPACNANTAKEQVYMFTIPDTAGTVGFNAESSGIDTVLDLKKIDITKNVSDECINASSLACSDDSTPPGDFGSKITRKLGPGTYILVVDGFNSEELGPFKLSVTFFHSGCTPICDGTQCGKSFSLESECASFNCGTCKSGMQCNDGSAAGPTCANGNQCVIGGAACSDKSTCKERGSINLNEETFRKCLPDTCFSPTYSSTNPLLKNGSECGVDICGSKAGCTNPEELCVYDPTDPSIRGFCKVFEGCNHLLPNCQGKCGKQEYCGSDCDCHKLADPVPDLIVGKELMSDPKEVLYEARKVAPTSCGYQENCLTGNPDDPTQRTRYLVRFPVEAINQGKGEFAQESPIERPDLYEFQTCHGHFHFNGFAKYELIDKAKNIALIGGKRSYCLEDTYQYDKMLGPDFACDPLFDCDAQGLQTGWVDLYSNDLDCQWLDVTEIVTRIGYTAQTFTLRITTNASRGLNEETFDNNASEIQITIPTKEGFQDLSLISNAPSPHK